MPLSFRQRLTRPVARNAQKVLRRAGFALVSQKRRFSDMEPEFMQMRDRIASLTLTVAERQYGLFNSIRYLHNAGIEGAFVECGVWKGGSAMLMTLALQHFGDTERELFLYDTFEGMSAPTDADVDTKGRKADAIMSRLDFIAIGLEEVRRNIQSTGYPDARVRYVQGKVEDTIPDTVPEKIALLRLDTDWYESTLHEMQHLWPRLVPGGVLVLDDYGEWLGARKAVDEYFAQNNINVLLHRTDPGCRFAVKPA